MYIVIPVSDVEELIVSLILDENVKGHIDQIKMTLILEPSGGAETRKYAGMSFRTVSYNSNTLYSSPTIVNTTPRGYAWL